jgi:serine/threonine protein kinase
VARAVCLAAQALHASNVVHRDFRQANIVCVSEKHCMVIDLELAAMADQIVPESMRERMPYWQAGTLDESEHGSVFSCMSDMHMIGCMLEQMGAEQHEGGLDFVTQLKSKQLTAEAALKHPFFSS